jgi:alpha-L-rhamnosidase
LTEHGGPRVGDLRCEALSNPLGIDHLRPRLRWRFTENASRKGLRQTAYEILAGHDPDGLRTGDGILWSRGHVSSEESANVPWSGPDLTSRTGTTGRSARLMNWA